MQASRFPLFVIAAVLGSHLALGEPYTPGSPDEVIARLAPGQAANEGRELRALRRSLDETPDDLALACDVAERLIGLARATGDPRHLSYAAAALRPWWEAAEPPIPALVLRATIRQSLHRFAEARADLQQAVRRDPANNRAWLTLGTIDLLQGRHAETRQACLRLLQRGEDFSATVLAAQLGAMSGQAKSAAERLIALLAESPDAPATQRLWAMTSLAEIQARLGQPAAAEASFRQALRLAPTDAYLLGTWVDFLLDQRRPGEAITALANHEDQDALLLRLAEARQMRGEPADLSKLPALVSRLETGFADARLRPEFIHHREEARFLLRLKHDPAAALPIAQENWSVQREPVDLRLVLEAAVAARRPVAARPVLDWIAELRYEDVALQGTLSKLAETTVAQTNDGNTRVESKTPHPAFGHPLPVRRGEGRGEGLLPAFPANYQ